MLKKYSNKLAKVLADRKSKSEDRLGFLDTISVILRIIKIMVDFAYVLVFLLAMLGAGMAFGYLASQVDSVKIPNKERLVKQVSSVSRMSKMTFADGSDISDIDTDLLRTPVASDDISENVKKAVIATEDETFESHNGVVPKAVIRATLASVIGFGESSGGSSLTQQLIKQQILGDDPTFKRKSKEIIYALALERYLSKDEILTDYLNVSPFGRNNKGENIAGVEEAARGIFGVSAKDLTVPQAAFIAGLPQSPIVYSPYAGDGSLKTEEDMALGLARQQNVLYSMYRAGYLTKEDYEEHKAYDIKQDFIKSEKAAASQHDYLYYTVLDEVQDIIFDYVVEQNDVSEQDLKNDETRAAYEKLAIETLQNGGFTVKTTINKNVHNAMQSAVEQHGGLLDDSSGRVETGNVLMDNSTGAILGFVGGRDYAANQNNHAFDTKRSPGSTIKPILPYGIAIDQGLLGSASVLSNYPTTFSSGEKIMHAGNEGTTMIPLQEAINKSTNITAFWTYKLLQERGVDVKSYMDKMNYSIPDYNIESLPLGGGIDTSVVSQVNIYQMIASGGIYHEQYMVESITDNEGKVIYQHQVEDVQVFSKATATILQELLRGPLDSGATTSFKSRLTGLNAGLAGKDWIGKTGTTNETADVWLMLATPNVTLGTWAGHDNNASLNDQAGFHNSANYTANLVNAINSADSSVFGDQRFVLDSSVIKSEVLKSTGLRPGQVSVNGRNFNLGGETTTSYWAKDGAGTTTYNFAIGGTDSDYQKAWSSIGR